MDLLIKGFLLQSNLKYADLGFQRVRKGYARIVNDVFQSFYIERLRGKYMGSNIYRIGFGVYPLCMELKCCDIGLYYLEHLSSDFNTAYAGWLCDTKRETSISSCLQAIFEIMDNDLIPMFQRADRCETALQALIHLDEQLYYHRQRMSMHNSVGGTERPWQIDSMFRSEKYYMALRNGNWKYADEYLALNISHNESVFDPNASVRQPLVVVENVTKSLKKWREERARLLAGDHLFFEQMLQHNEGKTRENLYRDSKGKIT